MSASRLASAVSTSFALTLTTSIPTQHPAPLLTPLTPRAWHPSPNKTMADDAAPIGPSAIHSTTDVFLVTGPLLWPAALVLYLTVADVNRRAAGNTGSFLYDLIVLTVIGFGGGIINPVLLADNKFFPFPIGSDIVIPCVAAAYVEGKRGRGTKRLCAVCCVLCAV